MKAKLDKIVKQYSQLQHDEDVYDIGGGLAPCKYASIRHEAAKGDEGKLTLGAAVQLFKRATGMETKEIKQLIHYVYPHLEWHHAGVLPKRYGGGMKKTYFVNAAQIIDLALNWNDYTSAIEHISNIKEL